MLKRMSLGLLLLGMTSFPVFAGDGGDDSAVTGVLLQAFGRLGAKLAGILFGTN